MAFKRSRAPFEGGDKKRRITDGEDEQFVPVWKQEVRDEQGRKRLHGAFTGGFSAGYFNTVGSKEGWTPSTFVSSRAKRHDNKDNAQQKPEDFMDDEDLADAEDAQKLETSRNFSAFGSSTATPTSGGLLMDLARPEGETMGTKLLQRMGWRPGQGIGPKVRRSAREDGESDDVDAGRSLHMFAPDNSQMIHFNQKSDQKGLGFHGEIRLDNVNDGQGSDDDVGPQKQTMSVDILAPRAKKISKPRKNGFGVGVLNDTGSDEEDPYEIGPRLSYNRVIGGDKKKKKKLKKSLAASTDQPEPLQAAITPPRTQTDAGVLAGPSRHSKRQLLAGFILAMHSASDTRSPRYPFPAIPPDWKSSKTSRSATQTSSTSSTYVSTADAAKSSQLSPKSRAALLGEKALPGKSVFDFLTPSARTRLSTATGRSDLPPALSEPGPTNGQSSNQKQANLAALVPTLDPSLAEAALARSTSAGWTPYADNDAKRTRYRAFLTHAARSHHPLPDRPSEMSVEDWVRELDEFAHAARVFKPLSGMMASRFTSASSASSPSSLSAPPRTHNPTDIDSGDPENPLLSRPGPAAQKKKPENPAEQAAYMDMYGPLTRTESPFAPTRLLCKRFGVPVPVNVTTDGPTRDDHVGAGGDSAADFDVGAAVVDASVVAKSSDRDVVNKATMDRMMREVALHGGGGGGVGGGSALGGGHGGDVMVKAAAKVDVERNEALDGERPGEAVFRAIFGSEDEDEDENGDGDEKD